MKLVIAKPSKETGSILVTILVIMGFLGTLLFGLIVLSSSNLARARGRIMLLQAQYAAESGADAAVAYFNDGNDSYDGTDSDVTILNGDQYKATYEVSVEPGSDDKEKIVTAIGKVYAPASASEPSYTRKLRVTAQRTSLTSSSSMASRNIIYVASGVKNIKGRDVYVNGFIHLDKNTTNLIAENITVAGKNTGASNCSIGGSGQLVKPTSFVNPGQTKTQVHTAFNVCVNPPGNNSNANFDISANQAGIATIKSMFIPWDQYLDGTYSAAGNCNDWTTGASPRTIPSVAGSKLTHYPNSDSNIATNCGTSGNINLGTAQYNITDHVHVRANFCSAAACNPTFHNPTPDLKFIFVEGSVNFGSLRTAAGSGPIALVSYGPDPASKSSVCPYGGSVYLGDNGDSAAPAMYLLATNGLCLEKTKFAANPALGGLSGKNLYIATSPGTPFDLSMDTAFPVSQIPIDLSWRAVRYERL